MRSGRLACQLKPTPISAAGQSRCLFPLSSFICTSRVFAPNTKLYRYYILAALFFAIYRAYASQGMGTNDGFHAVGLDLLSRFHVVAHRIVVASNHGTSVWLTAWPPFSRTSFCSPCTSRSSSASWNGPIRSAYTIRKWEENPHSLALCSPCVWKTVCVFS